MPFDPKAFAADIAKKAGWAPEKLSQFETFLAESAVAQEMNDALQRQSDYSRNMQQLQQERQAVLASQQALAQWKLEADRKLEQSDADLASKTRAIYSIAEEYRIDPQDLARALGGSAAPAAQVTAPAAPPTAPAFDTSKFIGAEKHQADMIAILTLQGELSDIAEEHRRLFGTPFESTSALIKKGLEVGDLRKAWTESYPVEQKQKEVAEAQFEARVQERVQAELTKRASDAVLDPTRGMAAPSVRSPLLNAVYQKSDGAPAPAPAQAPGQPAPENFHDQQSQTRDRITAAVEFFNQQQNSQHGFPA